MGAMDLGLAGKRALVTGGNRGIGRCCALALAGEGAQVCVTARDQALLDAVVGEIETGGKVGGGHAVAADLTSPEGCQRVFEAAVATLGGVDVLVNCAGAARGGDILHLSADLIDDALRLKSYSYLRLSQLVIPGMREAGWGRIVHIAGAAGTSPTQGNLPISLANIAILNMTRALSDAVAGDGILVNAICPGWTNTQRLRDLQQVRADREGRDLDAIVQEVGESLPAGRVAEPEEIARTAAFLASDACSYLFGNAIYMEGGMRRSTP